MRAGVGTKVGAGVRTGVAAKVGERGATLAVGDVGLVVADEAEKTAAVDCAAKGDADGANVACSHARAINAEAASPTANRRTRRPYSRVNPMAHD